MGDPEADAAREFLKSTLSAQKDASTAAQNSPESLANAPQLHHESMFERGRAALAFGAPEMGATAGSILGGAAGAAMGGPIGGPLGAIGGAALGGLFGSAIKDYGNDRQSQGTKIVGEGLAQGAYEALALGTVGGANKLLSGVTGRSVHGIVEYDAAMRDAAREGRDALIASGHDPEVVDSLIISAFTPAQASKGKALDVLENFARGSAFTKNSSALLDAQTDLTKMLPEILSKKLGPLMTKDAVAAATVEKFKNLSEMGKGRIGGMYDVIDRRMGTDVATYQSSPHGEMTGLMGGGDQFSAYTPAKQAADGQVDVLPALQRNDVRYVIETGNSKGMVSLGDIRGSLKRQQQALDELPRSLDPEGINKFVSLVRSLPDKVSFGTAKELRTDIMKIARDISSVDPKANLLSVTSELDNTLTRAMKTAVNDFDRETEKQWATKGRQGAMPSKVAPLLDLSNKWTADFYSRVDTEMTRGWIRLADEKEAGSKVLDGLLTNGPERVDHYVNGVLGKDSAEAGMIRAWDLHNMWDQARASGGQPSGTRFLAALDSMTKTRGLSTMTALHGAGNLENYRLLGKALETVESRGSREGYGWLRYMETAVGGPAFLAVMNPGTPSAVRRATTIAGGSYIIGVKALDRLLSNPKTARAVIDGAKFGTRTARGLAAAERVLGMLGRNEYEGPLPTRASPAELTAINKRVSAMGLGPAH